MKARIIEKEKEVKFEPFVLELTIESVEQLCDLLHRLNPIAKDVNKASGDWLKYPSMDTPMKDETLWDVLYDKATTLNLIK